MTNDCAPQKDIIYKSTRLGIEVNLPRICVHHVMNNEPLTFMYFMRDFTIANPDLDPKRKHPIAAEIDRGQVNSLREELGALPKEQLEDLLNGKVTRAPVAIVEIAEAPKVKAVRKKPAAKPKPVKAEEPAAAVAEVAAPAPEVAAEAPPAQVVEAPEANQIAEEVQADLEPITYTPFKETGKKVQVFLSSYYPDAMGNFAVGSKPEKQSMKDFANKNAKSIALKLLEFQEIFSRRQDIPTDGSKRPRVPLTAFLLIGEKRDKAGEFNLVLAESFSRKPLDGLFDKNTRLSVVKSEIENFGKAKKHQPALSAV